MDFEHAARFFEEVKFLAFRNLTCEKYADYQARGYEPLGQLMTYSHLEWLNAASVPND